MLKNLRRFNYVTAFIVVNAIIISGLIFGNFRQKVSAEVLSTNQVSNEKAVENLGSQAVYFEENRGQFNSKVRYFARGTNGYSLFLTGTDAVYVLRTSPKSEVQSPKSKSDDLMSSTLDFGLKTKDSTATAVYMTLAGANENAVSEGSQMLEHRTNYFKGDESNWRTDIPNYQTVRTNGVYEGVDTVWYGKQNGGVQYDFVVQPTADASQIEWEIKGAKDVELTDDGDLIIKTDDGEIKQNKPFTYQETDGLRAEVASGFVLSETSVSANSSKTFKVKFNVGDYDDSKSLTIDPSVNLSNLALSTFLGGNANDTGRAIAIDRVGNLYVTGFTQSTQFPTTAGTIDTTQGGTDDVFVTKMNATGSALLYSTYLGGDLQDVPLGIKVDASGNAFITGRTVDAAADYPTTAGALSATHNGGIDVFVTKINPAGSALVYSTFIGGSLSDQGAAVAIDLAGNAYITGLTTGGSPAFPTTAGAFDTTHNGNEDVFVSKLNASGSALIYSTFIGGNGIDHGNSIAVDSSGSVFIVGSTFIGATSFPTTTGAFDQIQNGGFDAFVTKLNPTGSALDYSTFIGGSLEDFGNSIAIDATGNALVTGSTQADAASPFPTTAGAFDTTQNGGNDAFATKLNPTGSALVYSTFLGGTANDVGNNVTTDDSGNAFIIGTTFDAGTDYPTTTGAYDTTHNGSDDVFVTSLNGTGSGLDYSTFIGGSGFDTGFGIAVDASGNVFITGRSFFASTQYPTTEEVFDKTHNGGDDVIISKLGDFSIAGRTLDTSGNPLPNTAIGLSGDTDGFMFSDASGNFNFSDTLSFGNYLVSATQILYNFNPSNFEIKSLNRNKRVTFVGRPTTSGPTAAFADLGGDVTSTAGNAGLPNTTLTLIDTYGNVRTTVTDAAGNYEFQEVQTGGFFIVFAQREGYNFDPGNAQVAFLDENLDIDFTASPTSPRPVQDFDGDGKTDLAVYRPNEGNWYILQSQNNSMKVVNFGLNGDIPVAEDYDGDDRADIAVYRPSNGNWYRLNSSNGAFSSIHFGATEDRPIPADFDGDGKTDIAVYRPSSGVWHRLNSTDGSYHAVKFGISEDKPVPSDFDRDGKADLVVYRPSSGVWHRLNSSDGNYIAYQFGLPEDKPMAADFDGDGTPDTAVYRPSNGVWYSLDSADNDFHAVQFGIQTDTPVPADYNGDGRIEQAIYRRGTWYQLFSNGNSAVSQFGNLTDLPVAAIR